MSLMDAAKFLMTDTVTIAPWIGQDNYAQGTYGPAVTYQCRIQVGSNRLMAALGQEEINHVRIYIPVPLQGDPRDQITIPAKYGERDADGDFVAPRVVLKQVEPIIDHTGHVGTIFVCGRG